MLFERRSVSLTSPPKWLVEYLGGGEGSYAEESVTVEGSLKVSAVLAAFTILIEDIASLPLILYRRLERGKERAPEHSLYSLLHDAPNPEHTSMVFREIEMGHLLGWGNFYGQKLWDGRGVLREIWPLKPNQMQVWRDRTGERKYLYRRADGTPIAFRQEEILHIPAFGFDGLVGYSRIALARNAIGLSMAAEKYGSKTFANGARPSAVLTSPKPMDLAVQERLKDSWEASYRGAANAGKTAVLEDGLDIKTIGFPPEQAQFLETRQFQVEEIARIFRVPPHMIGNVEKSTSWGSGIEQQEMGYLSHTLRPWMTRIEQQISKDLLLKDERRVYFAEHLADALLRTDLSARMTAYATALTNGVMTANEARERENMNPYNGGDVVRVQLSTAPIDSPAAQGIPQNSKPGPEVKAVPEPLLRDAIERIVRRELHDVADAWNRWGEKKPEKFTAWQVEFFRQDHPDFIVQQLMPFVRAEYLTEARVRQAADAYCEAGEWTLPVEISESDQELLTERLLSLLATHVASTSDAGSTPARGVEEVEHA